MSVSWLSMSWAAVWQAELVQDGCQTGSPSSGGERGQAGCHITDICASSHTLKRRWICNKSTAVESSTNVTSLAKNGFYNL